MADDKKPDFGTLNRRATFQIGAVLGALPLAGEAIGRGDAVAPSDMSGSSSLHFNAIFERV